MSSYTEQSGSWPAVTPLGLKMAAKEEKLVLLSVAMWTNFKKVIDNAEKNKLQNN